MRWLVGALLAASGPAAAQDVLLFGGSHHDVFLGCLNCSEYDSDSICNEYGAGSRYTSNSIFNPYGTFGSKYSADSPWNKYSSASGVPVLVDESGAFYGYFTINRYRSDAFGGVADLADLYDAVEGDLEIIQNLICE